MPAAETTETKLALFRAACAGDTLFGGGRPIAGANANGSPELPFAPIMAAAVRSDPVILGLLIDQGADPDRPAFSLAVKRSFVLGTWNDSWRTGSSFGGEARQRRHRSFAAEAGPRRSQCHRQERSHRTRDGLRVRARRRRLGAVASRRGRRPGFGRRGRRNPSAHGRPIQPHRHVRRAVPVAPGTLNSYTVDRHMPLFMACVKDHARMTSRLLALGAVHTNPMDVTGAMPLVAATVAGFERVVRVLINDGMEAVGGRWNFHITLYGAVNGSWPRILRLLLAVGGEHMRPHWANSETDGRQLLHHAAAIGYPTVVSLLLAAGANEAVHDSEGRIPRDDIGVELDEGVQMDRGKEVAIRRMLERGPAYRARPWA
ncbi:unnamed protein product [Laminaria digitata]